MVSLGIVMLNHQERATTPVEVSHTPRNTERTPIDKDARTNPTTMIQPPGSLGGAVTAPKMVDAISSAAIGIEYARARLPERKTLVP